MAVPDFREISLLQSSDFPSCVSLGPGALELKILDS